MGNDLVTKVCLFVTFRVLGHRHYTKKNSYNIKVMKEV